LSGRDGGFFDVENYGLVDVEMCGFFDVRIGGCGELQMGGLFEGYWLLGIYFMLSSITLKRAKLN